MRKQRSSIRVFQSDFLERFTHVHPVTPLVIWMPIFAWLIWHSYSVNHLSVFNILVAGFFAFFLWTFTEYVLHRYIFHFNAETKGQERLRFLIHGLHHDDPEDATRLVMPPVPAIVLGLIHFAIFRIFLGPVWVEPFFAFFVVGYLCYDYIHFAVHHFKPRTRIGKYLKQSHMQHHFVTPHARWGVSSPLWDYVFGTLEEKKEEKRLA